MTCSNKKLFAEIIPGSKAVFDLILKKDDGTPFNLTPYSAGKLVFLNTAGVRTEITLTIPGLVPGAGIIQVEISSAQSADADGKWANADLELVLGADTEIRPLKNKFQISPRFAPVIIP